MDAILAGICTFAIILTCALHYAGIVNVHLKLAAWHLSAARRCEERQAKQAAGLREKLEAAWAKDAA
jgi:hypothetical protein